MKHTALLAPLALTAALALPSCHISIDGSGYDEFDVGLADASATRIQNLRRDNRRKLDQLEIGMARADVDRVMGTESTRVNRRIGWVDSPYKTSSFRDAQGRQVTVLYYYTDVRHRDDILTDDELTPVVLRDGAVIGWGRAFTIPAADS